MDNDDDPVGRLLTRRQATALGGVPALAFLAGCSTGIGSDGAASDGSVTTADTGSDGSTSTATPMSTADPEYPATGTITSTSVTTDEGTTACVAQPELTEGPYYVDDAIRRSDIREQQAGVRLDLGYAVYELTDDGCTPLAGAVVDVWHANADGVYSGVQAQETTGTDFLRGTQLTDADGAASFTTIYPGWCPGRAVHVHFKTD